MHKHILQSPPRFSGGGDCVFGRIEHVIKKPAKPFKKSIFVSAVKSYFCPESPRKILIPAFMYPAPQKLRNGHSVFVPRCPAYKAYFRLTPDSRVRVFFIKRHLPTDILQLHFGKGLFEMPFAYELPPIVLLKLGLESFKIFSGLYPIQEDLDFISVDF